MKALVSIIITTYNRATLIKETIHSCLNQSYPDFEIIVIDDGSTDNTKEVLEEFIAAKQLQYYYLENGERAAARNAGVKLSKGQYIKFLDSDDLIEKDHVEICVRYFEENKNCELLHTNCKVLNADGSISLSPKKGVTGNVYESLWESNDISLSSVMMKRTVFEKWDGFDETRSLSGAEDWEYWVRLSKQGCVVGFVPTYVTIIRMHSDNCTMNDIDKIVFSAREGQRLLEQKFDISKSLKRKFAARLIYMEAIYFYIDGKKVDCLGYLIKATLINRKIFFKADSWALLLKNLLPKKIISLLKQRKRLI